ncbi:MAG TPA: TetR/AcrR family transcriptional regulator [Streptosporangiaceae bacterium]
MASGDLGRPGRVYQSPRRVQAAADTRAAILAAALRLFREHGYGKVTVQDIAREASTAVPTVYASTGGKGAILGILINDAVQDPIVAETLAAVDACADPREAIRALVHGVRVDNEQYHDIVRIMKDAAAVEQAAADVLVRSDDIYRHYLGQAVDRVRETGTLRPGLTRLRAVDITWFYLGHESWHVLAVTRQWTWDEAEQWLAGQLTSALLGAE